VLYRSQGRRVILWIGALAERDAVKWSPAICRPATSSSDRGNGRWMNTKHWLKKESRRSIGSAIMRAGGVSRNLKLLPGQRSRGQRCLDANGTYGVVKVIHTWSR